jgi:hypothetical protein
LWKDADPDIPIPKEAKAEYAKLRALNIPPTKSLLFKDMAFKIENEMRQGNEERR